MKNLFVALALMLFVGSASAADLTLELADSIAAADTAASAERWDTSYSAEIDINGASRLQFTGVSILPEYRRSTAAGYVNVYSNLTTDTFFVHFQVSNDGANWVTYVLDTLLDTTSMTYPLDFTGAAASDSCLLQRGRYMLVHFDDFETDSPTLDSSVYVWKSTLYYNLIK